MSKYLLVDPENDNLALGRMSMSEPLKVVPREFAYVYESGYQALVAASKAGFPLGTFRLEKIRTVLDFDPADHPDQFEFVAVKGGVAVYRPKEVEGCGGCENDECCGACDCCTETFDFEWADAQMGDPNP